MTYSKTTTIVISHCPKCENEHIEVDHSFCGRCGNDLRPCQVTLVCCGRTQLITHDGWNFCPFCGANSTLRFLEA